MEREFTSDCLYYASNNSRSNNSPMPAIRALQERQKVGIALHSPEVLFNLDSQTQPSARNQK
jgi:hypothetical protein